MKFSICIPNYNYERFLGRTIRSVLVQTHADLEVLVSDNASTDNSVEVVHSFDDPRVKLHVNRCNVGFSGNLDRAGRLAVGEHMIMLSSDDIMRPSALATYQKFHESLGYAADSAIVSSTWDVIDPEDRVTGEMGPDPELWKEVDRDARLERLLGFKVFSVEAGELLRRCLVTMKNPFNFAATCYPRSLYEQVEGYGAGRLINPDKWYHWKLLAVAVRAYFLDHKLFAYRWHPNNQTAIQASAGALKYSVDQYVGTLEVDSRMLERAGLTRQQIVEAFVERDVARHGLATLGSGDRSRAARIYNFGKGCYPAVVRGNRNAQILRGLLALGPVGRVLAQRAYRRYRDGNLSVYSPG